MWEVQPPDTQKRKTWSLPLEVAPVMHEDAILLKAERSFHRQAKIIANGSIAS